jgi:hypothetical protein
MSVGYTNYLKGWHNYNLITWKGYSLRRRVEQRQEAAASAILDETFIKLH